MKLNVSFARLNESHFVVGFGQFKLLGKGCEVTALSKLPMTFENGVLLIELPKGEFLAIPANQIKDLIGTEAIK